MKMSKIERAESAERRAAMRARLARLETGIAAEVDAVNAALQAGTVVTVPVREGSQMSGKTVASVRNGYDGIWVTMKNYGGSYALANDERWGEIVTLAGLTRDSRALGTRGNT